MLAAAAALFAGLVAPEKSFDDELRSLEATLGLLDSSAASAERAPVLKPQQAAPAALGLPICWPISGILAICMIIIKLNF